MIEIILLNNKRSRQAIDGLDVIVASQPGGYAVMAGEENATQIKVQYPSTYTAQNGYVYMQNARGEYAIAQFGLIPSGPITFTLPSSMTYVGNTLLVFHATTESAGSQIRTVWSPVVVPVKETSIDYTRVAVANPDILQDIFTAASAATQAAQAAQNAAILANNNAITAQADAARAIATAESVEDTLNESLRKSKQAVTKAQQASESVDLAVSIAEGANDTAENAIAVAEQANTNSQSAVELAQSADEKSSEAVRTADRVEDTLNESLRKSKQAVTRSQQAGEEAITAIAIAAGASDTAENALAVADTAENKSDLAVLDAANALATAISANTAAAHASALATLMSTDKDEILAAVDLLSKQIGEKQGTTVIQNGIAVGTFNVDDIEAVFAAYATVAMDYDTGGTIASKFSQIVAKLSQVTKRLDNLAELDLTDGTATFTQASTRLNIDTADKVYVILGKVKKWFADLRALAFKDKIADIDVADNADINGEKIGGMVPLASYAALAGEAEKATTAKYGIQLPQTDNSNKLATTSYVRKAIADLIATINN